MIIRKLNENDGKDYLNLMLKLDQETEFMLYEPGERKTTPEQMTDRLISNLDKGGVVLGAFEEEKLTGFISLIRGAAKRIRHCGYVVIGVTQESSGKGVGSKLLDSLDEWAMLHGISKLELTVMAHNRRAYELYLRNGYEVEGTKTSSIQIRGQFFDEYYMGKTLKNENS